MFKKVPDGKLCPMLNKQCVTHQCAMYICVRGTNPQTGAEVDDWGCSFAFMPVLMIENSQQQRQTGAAVESFRNEVVKANKVDEVLRERELAALPADRFKLIG